MIDGSENRNRLLAFELQNSYVCEKRSNFKVNHNFCSLNRFRENSLNYPKILSEVFLMYNNSVRVLKPFVNSTAKCNDLNPVFISWLWRITYCNKCLRI